MVPLPSHLLHRNSGVNAFILRQLSPNHARTMQLKFRLELINNLLGNYCSSKRSAGVMEVVAEKTHFPGKGLTNRCMQCAKTGRRQRSTCHCALCDITLCIAWFEPFHSEQHWCLMSGQHGGAQNLNLKDSAKSKRWTHCCKYCKFYLSELDFNSLNNIFCFKVFYKLVGWIISQFSELCQSFCLKVPLE